MMPSLQSVVCAHASRVCASEPAFAHSRSHQVLLYFAYSPSGKRHHFDVPQLPHQNHNTSNILPCKDENENPHPIVFVNIFLVHL